MFIREIYDYLVDTLQTLVISRNNNTGFEVFGKNGDALFKKMNRLFFRYIYPDSGVPSSAGDVNTIMKSGLINNRDKGGIYAQNILQCLLEDNMNYEKEYMEKLIKNSISFTICLNERYEKVRNVNEQYMYDFPIEELVDYVMANHRDLYTKKYRTFCDAIQRLCKKTKISIPKGSSADEMICLMLADSAIKLKINNVSDKKQIATIRELQKKLKALVNTMRCSESSLTIDKYYCSLWQKYHCLELRDGDGSLALELADVLVLPEIRSEKTDLPVKVPFSGDHRRVYIHAKSGIGKTTLLRSLAVIGIAKHIKEHHSDIMSANEISAYEAGKYEQFRDYFYADNCENLLPVYIQASKFNIDSPKSLLTLADFFGTDLSEEMIRSAYEDNRLSLFIDSLDEVAEKNVYDFNQKLVELVGEFPNAQIIMTSRFSGRKPVVDGFENMLLMGFSEDSIVEYITKVSKYIGNASKNEQFMKFITENKYALELAQNPFMLSVMMESENTVSKCLSSITTAIIDRRLRKQLSLITPEGIKALLCYIAFETIFVDANDNRISKGILAQKIRNARDKKLLNMYAENITLSDDEIHSFLGILSCQSGIMNILSESGADYFVFQDELVMCYLAADFLVHLTDSGRSIFDDGEVIYLLRGRHALHHNIRAIDTFIEKLKDLNEMVLSKNLLITADLVITLLSGIDSQKALISYLLIKGFMSHDNRSYLLIKQCISDIYERKFGDNRVVNRHELNNETEYLIKKFLSMPDIDYDNEVTNDRGHLCKRTKKGL